MSEEVSQENTEDTQGSTEQTPESKEVESKEESQEESTEQAASEDKGEEDESEESQEEESEESEEVEYKLELSEDSKLAKEHLDEIAEFSKKHGLSNEAAQEVLKAQEGLVSGMIDKFQEARDAEISSWGEQSANDPEIGGDNLKRSAERAKRAVEAFGSEDFLNGLKETGYGDHPEVIRIFSKIGELLEDDSLVVPGKSLGKRSKAETLYGNNN